MRMTTPIRDFVEGYVAADAVRLHMPGHKGASLLGFEAYDITEVAGADSLYEADGIIRQSEQNASRLFGCRTYYSTEGSSQCIRAMLQLVGTYAGVRGIDRPLVLAGRNAHKTFLSAAALLDLDVEWLYPDGEDGYLTCTLTPARLEAYLAAAERLPAAVYVTSPDYLGNVADVAALAAVCHAHGVLLLVDNAHGAYLKFLKPSRHPMDLGADLCCDSAHKTLPVLTGGAYLHVGAHLTALSEERVKHALALFGSTSPSYLILQSLDLCNAVMDDEDFAGSLQLTAARVAAARARLEAHGLTSVGDEPLKLTIAPRAFGYTGNEVAAHLRARGLECEFADPDVLVLMFTPAITEQDVAELVGALSALPRRAPLPCDPPRAGRPARALSVREAMLSPAETLPACACAGRVLAMATVGCPPAVPIVASGEVIDAACIAACDYYGIKTLTVVKN